MTLAPPPIMLAQRYEDRDVAGWLVSEKLDGVRAWWNGAQLVSRDGNAFNAPQWFVAGLGPEPLDGELWLGRGRFQQTVAIVRGSDSDTWRSLTYRVFDAPRQAGGFAQRLAWLERWSAGAPRTAAVVEHWRCRGDVDADRRFRRLVDDGAEGIVLRDPAATYQCGRSAAMLKRKAVEDIDAIVIAHQPGRGRLSDCTGALVLQTPSGVVFRVGAGLTDADHRRPPAIGDLVIVRHQGVTDSGQPRHAVYVGPRAERRLANDRGSISADRTRTADHVISGRNVLCRNRDVDDVHAALSGNATLHATMGLC